MLEKGDWFFTVSMGDGRIFRFWRSLLQVVSKTVLTTWLRIAAEENISIVSAERIPQEE